MVRDNLVGIYDSENVEQSRRHYEFLPVIRRESGDIGRIVPKPNSEQVQDSRTQIAYEAAILNQSREQIAPMGLEHWPMHP